MKKAFSFLVLVFLSGTFSARLSAELSMPHIFADHMVLQRNEAVNLWGSASPKEKVTVELNGQKTSVRADASGKWNATLRPMEAGGPYTLIVKGKKERLAFDDVLLGEVWAIQYGVPFACCDECRKRDCRRRELFFFALV